MIVITESQFPDPGGIKDPGAAVPRLNSDKSFVVSKEGTSQKK